jgi:hypothetical protein
MALPASGFGLSSTLLPTFMLKLIVTYVTINLKNNKARR